MLTSTKQGTVAGENLLKIEARNVFFSWPEGTGRPYIPGYTSPYFYLQAI
jgi:hypothetical protein